MRRKLLSAAAAVVAAGAGAVLAQQTPRVPGEQIYEDTCAGCHASGRAPNLLDRALLAVRTDDALRRTIHAGVPDAGMPAFQGMLSDEQVWEVISYLRNASDAASQAAAPPPPTELQGLALRGEKQAFSLEVLVRGLETPWGMAFLPDGGMLISERPGRLRFFRDGRLSDPVAGTPTVFERQDAGLLDVTVHPNYARNGWVYLAYVEVAPGHAVSPPAAAQPSGQRPANPPNMTVVVRGRIDKQGRWVDQQTIFRAPANLYTGNGSHYGSRFAWDKTGKLLFSIGDRGDMTNAQKLDNPLGKIHRVNDDGSPAADNPFVGRSDALPTIWSFGHRNPEGLAWEPATGRLWESEHGPVGGDEINIVEKGGNYGWGVVSMGVQPGISERERQGMISPVAYYTPAIAPAGIAFVSGERYPGWRGDLLVGGLVGQQLRRLEIADRTVGRQEVLFRGLGRVRDLEMGPDGYLYALVQSPTGPGTGLSVVASTPGYLVRLKPTP